MLWAKATEKKGKRGKEEEKTLTVRMPPGSATITTSCHIYAPYFVLSRILKYVELTTLGLLLLVYLPRGDGCVEVMYS